jgi:DNA invertase Pin-like site-specific DNA recombinase
MTNALRTDPEGRLPPREQQWTTIEACAREMNHELVADYEDLEASGTLLYHKPALKEAIENIKEDEDWEVLLVAEPHCVSDDESAIHELVHKFSLYGNRLECPYRSWEDFLATMTAYRRKMAQR